MEQLDRLQNAVEQTERIRIRIAIGIRFLPDNPRINRLNDRCFILQFKDLGCNWTPEYHDFKRQYNLLSQAIGAKSPAALTEFLKTVVQKGAFKVNSYHTVKLHPDVIGHLRSFLEFKF